MGLFYLKTSAEALNEHEESQKLVRKETSVHAQHGPVEYYQLGERVFVAHYPIPTYFYEPQQTSHLHQDGQAKCLTLIQGYCYEREPAGELSGVLDAASIRRIIIEENYDIEALRTRLAGEYSIIHANSDGNVYAFNDICGMEHIYFCNRPEEAIVTNRIALTETERDRSSTFDFNAALSLPTLAFMTGNGTYLKDAKKLRQDRYLTVEKNQICEVALKPHFYHFGRIPESTNDPMFANLLRKGVSESVTWLRFATSKEEKIKVAITGGKDSRTVLAMCLKAGLKDRIELFTNGPDDSPEVIIGKQIAELCGLPHTTNPTRHAAGISPIEFHRNFAVHAYQTEALMTPWDVQNRGPYRLGLNLGGMCGEFFRPFKQPGALISNKHRINSITRYFDPLGIIDEDTKNTIANNVIRELEAYKQYGAVDDDLPNIHHINCYSGWYGTSLRQNSYAVTNIKPLYSYFLNNLAFAIPADVRSTEIIHYSIIEECYPDLLDLPFYMQRWDPRLADYGKKKGIDVKPLPKPENLPAAGSWQNQFNTSDSLRKTTAALLNENKESDFWKFVNLQRVQQLIKDHSFQGLQLHSLFGVLGAFYKRENIEIPRQFYSMEEAEECSSDILLVPQHLQKLNYTRRHNDQNFDSSMPGNSFITNEFAIRILAEDLFEYEHEHTEPNQSTAEKEVPSTTEGMSNSPPYMQIVRQLAFGPNRRALASRIVEAVKARLTL